MIELRPYQSDMIARIREAMGRTNRVLGVAPCGAGKTVMFSYIASRARERGHKVGIFVHRIELAAQVSKTLSAFKVPHGMIMANSGIDRRHSVYVISVQTYARSIHKMPQLSIGVLDEAHHAAAKNTWAKCMEHSPNAKWLGMSASPARLDGQGLSGSFSEMVIGPSARELIDIGALCDYRLFAPSTVDMSGCHILAGDFKQDEMNAAVDKPRITGDAVEHYRKHLNGAPTIVFCASVAHAEHVAEAFKAEGYAASSVDGKMEKLQRRRVIGDFSDGKLNIMTSCSLVSEGLDIPGIHGCILLRPTASLALYIQQVGRAMRTAPGKERAIILDHTGNCGRHGLPCADREWTLEGRKKGTKAPPEASMSRECGICFTRFNLNLYRCPECNAPVAQRVREIEQIDGELTEVDKEEVRKLGSPAKLEQGRAKSLKELEELAAKRGYKPGWAKHIWEARNGKRARA